MQEIVVWYSATRVLGASKRFQPCFLIFLLLHDFVLSETGPTCSFHPVYFMRSLRVGLVRRSLQERRPFSTFSRPPFGNSICTLSSIQRTNHHTFLPIDSGSKVRLMSSLPDFDAVANKDDAQPAKSEFTEYEHWVRRLYQTNLFNPVKLGLKNIEELHEALGRPTEQVPIVHIAGTNGKGSVALKIAHTLQMLNPSLRVGLFVSPHVSSFRERMQINGEPISEDEVVAYLPELYEICEERDIPATFFEITTALAFMFFQRADVIVLETGLGGRLDATNVVASPSLSIITSIGLEHTRILGDTIEEIAREKGGIIKPGRPVLVGPNVPHEVLRACAQEKGASEYLTCDDVLGESSEEITDYDQENSRIAQAALKIFSQVHPDLIRSLSAEILEKGTSVRPSCRFEIVTLDNELQVVLDVAHNPPAMEYLLRKLRSTFPGRNFRVVVGMSSDKDVGLVGKMLLDVVDVNAIHLVEAFHPRAAKLESIFMAEPRLQDSHWNSDDRTVTTQLNLALDLARDNGEVLVVCGSVFLMADARERLGFVEPKDSDCISEVAGAHFRNSQEVFANTNPMKESNTPKVSANTEPEKG